MNSFVIGNPDKCIGCRTCYIACVDAHSKGNMFLSKEKDIEFNPRLSVIKTAKITGPIQCRQCEDAPCLSVCPNGSITNKNDVVIINKDNCIGCKSCAMACPFGAIEMAVVGDKVIANKCDLCASRENGPACVEVCLTGGLKLVNEDEVKDSVSKKLILNLKDLGFISKG
mgnify:CR=1 FL=1